MSPARRTLTADFPLPTSTLDGSRFADGTGTGTGDGAGTGIFNQTQTPMLDASKSTQAGMPGAVGAGKRRLS